MPPEPLDYAPPAKKKPIDPFRIFCLLLALCGLVQLARVLLPSL